MKDNLFFFNFQYMIQRIQSLYLFFYLIIKSFLLYLYSKDENLFHFFINELDLFFLVLILLIVTSTVTLFSFKKRKIQIKLIYFLITIQLIILILILNMVFVIDNSINFLLNYRNCLYLFGLILLLLSLRGIKKDQNLIDSIDRIR